MSISPSICADLSVLAALEARASERVEAFVAGGGGAVTRDMVRRERVAAEIVPEGIRLTVEAATYRGELAHLEDHPHPVFLDAVPGVLGLPESWEGWERLEIEISDADAPLEVELVIFGTRSRLSARGLVSPGEAAVIGIPLVDLPLIQGNLPSYQPQGVRLLFRARGTATHASCMLRRLALCGAQAAGPVLDRWGQRIHADWPGKVQTDADLVRAREEEAVALPAFLALPDRGRFGGWTGGPRFTATGVFRVKRDVEGRWWYVDPDGWPFWSLGPTCVNVGDATRTAGREHLFAELPAPGEYPEGWDEEHGYLSHYALNIYRKYGSRDAWSRRVRERLQRWGANTLANWSDTRLGGDGIVYVKTLSSRFPEMTYHDTGMPDVFHPAWEAQLQERFMAEARPLADDPWLLGYFVDNEMPWGKLDPAAAGAYAERYFATVRRALKAADPHHLYMGCRFVRVPPAEAIVRAAGRHVDVLSINCYSLVPRREEFDRWYALTERPIQIGEHQEALRDPRQPPPVWTAFTAAERRRCYPAYDEAAARLPYCIGSHWFQFVDQPGTGRQLSVGENMLIGLVDITDQPYPHMVEALREIAENIYRWHREG